jgi:hypothetical protein
MSSAAQWMSSHSRDQSHPATDAGHDVHPHLETEHKRRDRLRAIIARSLDEEVDEHGVLPVPTPRSAPPTNRWS